MLWRHGDHGDDGEEHLAWWPSAGRHAARTCTLSFTEGDRPGAEEPARDDGAER